jgi:hypothetical protein
MSTLIKERIAPVHFIHIKKKAVNGHLTGAKELAKKGSQLARVNSPLEYSNIPHPLRENSPVIDVDKVTANIPDDKVVDDPAPRKDWKKYPENHRGRDKLGTIKDMNRDKLINPPSHAAFWKHLKRLADPRPAPIAVTAEDLRVVFEGRLNPAPIMPSSFDQAQHKINQTLGSLIPEHTDDPTPEKFFSAEWLEDDGAWVKNHLLTHSLDSASGEDAITYADIMDIPNEDIVRLCNECVRLRDVPTIWLRNIIIGLLKRGKPGEIPNSYRIIALESCFLKILTLLIHRRITQWAAARGLIPDWQNGFREKYRTNNNPFVLRCVRDWARAHGKTVYVAAIDATNAFPSTDHCTLWLKLEWRGPYLTG